MKRLRRYINAVVWGAVVIVLGIGLLMWWMRAPLTETEVRRMVMTTIQQEAPASFYVTGVLTIAATSTVQETEYLMPQSFRLPLGATEATVRMPGHVSYGFSIDALRPEHIRIAEDGVVEVQLPELTTYSVEPDLSRMQIQTTTGTWQKWLGNEAERDRVQAEAFRQAQTALRLQADDYLRRSSQPHENTAVAMKKMLTPVLQAGGLEDPQFRFFVGPARVLEPQG